MHEGIVIIVPVGPRQSNNTKVVWGVLIERKGNLEAIVRIYDCVFLGGVPWRRADVFYEGTLEISISQESITWTQSFL